MSFSPMLREPSARDQKAEARRVKPTAADAKMARNTALILAAATMKNTFRTATEMRKYAVMC